MIDEGFVRVDGLVRKPSFILNGGEKIEMLRRGPEIPKAEPENIPLEILHEDDDLLVINKPAGLVVHPAPGHFKGTLVSAVLHHLGLGTIQSSSSPTSLRPGIVHRLDKGTTGLMVIAKNDESHRSLSGQFKNHKVEKIYEALIFGKPERKKSTIIKAIGRDETHRRKYSSKTRYAREAVTHYEVIESIGPISHVRVRLETGRTHQIRVHFSESRHPILGDVLYGAKSFVSMVKDEEVREALEVLDRPLLHARILGFTHPRENVWLRFEAPLPEDFEKYLKLLLKR